MMKSSTITFLCWVGSTLLAGVLFFLIYDFVNKQEAGIRPFDVQYVKSTLSEPRARVATDRVQLDYLGQVKPNMIDLDWTGKPVEVRVAPVVEQAAPTGPVYTPVSELLAVRYVQYDTVDPGGSSIFVEYLGALADSKTAHLSVGDKLPKPHDDVVLHRIETESIVFSFAAEGREEEELFLNPFGDLDLITLVGEGGVIKAPTRAVPQARRKVSTAPAETVRLGNGNYQIGTDDAQVFANDYQRILSQDVKTRTHFDANGNRAGIELVDVKVGSIASRHGAQTGDIIISINGHPVSSQQEAIKWAKNNADKFSVWEVVKENRGLQSTVVFNSPEN